VSVWAEYLAMKIENIICMAETTRAKLRDTSELVKENVL
jgi:hypothetical protein